MEDCKWWQLLLSSGICSWLTYFLMRRTQKAEHIRSIQAIREKARSLRAELTPALHDLTASRPIASTELPSWIKCINLYHQYMNYVNQLAEYAQYTIENTKYFRDEVLPQIKQEVDCFIDFAETLLGMPISGQYGFLQCLNQDSYKNLFQIFFGSLDSMQIRSYNRRLQSIGLSNLIPSIYEY